MGNASEASGLSKFILWVNRLLMHAAVGFNLYWLVFLQGRLLNDVCTTAWLGFGAQWVTLPLTLVNLLLAKDTKIRVLSGINAALLFVLLGLVFYDSGNHDWPHFILTSTAGMVIISVPLILPFALVSVIPCYVGTRLWRLVIGDAIDPETADSSNDSRPNSRRCR